MIVITGAAGFIGSCLLARLNAEGFYDIILADDFSREDKTNNYEGKRFTQTVERSSFFEWAQDKTRSIQFIFHLGARTDTAEKDPAVFSALNLDFSKHVWEFCAAHQIPLVYASSAATYGRGVQGYSDGTAPSLLSPMNLYGKSKNDFDQWVMAQETSPYFWAGLKFFNVYGPNEYHKGMMASVVFHAFRQLQKEGEIRLFRSHNPEYKDGEQRRDFIYVRDVVDILCFFMHHRKDPGIYNVGTGSARTFLDLAAALCRSAGHPPRLAFIDTPESVRENYQYYTCAAMEKLRGIGYTAPFRSLEEGVGEYVKSYLVPGKYF